MICTMRACVFACVCVRDDAVITHTHAHIPAHTHGRTHARTHAHTHGRTHARQRTILFINLIKPPIEKVPICPSPSFRPSAHLDPSQICFPDWVSNDP